MLRSVASRIARRSYAFTKWRHMRRMRRAKGRPVVVMSMPKTGSRSIENAVRAVVDRPVYKVHSLTPTRLTGAEERYRRREPDFRPRHLWQGQYLAEHLPTEAEPWEVVTSVRDPIAQLVSEFFQGSRSLGARRDTAPIASVASSAEKYVQQRLKPTLRWFDDDFAPHIGVDVYLYPFEHDEGYVVIEGRKARVLVMRQQNLDAAAQALGVFLGLDEVLMPRENVAAAREYADNYAAVKNALRFDRTTLELAYSSKLVRHFFRPDEIARLRRTWAPGAVARQRTL